MQSNTTKIEGGTLTITRIFNTPRKRVWKAWTDPETIKKWWGPKIFTAPHISIDFRVGGKYLYCMKSETGEEAWKKGFWTTGVYKEIVPMEKLVMTDSFADEHGNIVSGSEYGMEGIPEELEVTVTFEDVGDKTKITMVHTGFPEGEHVQLAGVGWNESFDKMAEALEQ
jgi:uncharacterized protein YndB with AHSA1/START domain